MPVVTDLIGRLGFSVDTTAATRFESAMKRSKNSLESFNQVRLDRFNKTIGAVFGIGIGAGAAGFFKFAEMKQALAALKGSLQDAFEPIRKEIESILQDKLIGNLIKELDLVNAAAVQAQEGLAPETLQKVLRPAALLALERGRSVSEVLASISSFIADANLDILKQTGILDQAQIEILKFAGTGPEKAGLRARTMKIIEVLAGAAPGIEKNLKELEETGALSVKELTTAFNKLLIEVGERTVPAFKALNDVLLPTIEFLTKWLDTSEERSKEVAKEGVKSKAFFSPFFPTQAELERGDPVKESLSPISKDIKQNLSDFWERTTKEFVKDFQVRASTRQAPVIPISGVATDGGNAATELNINNNITISPGANADPVAIKGAINDAMRQSFGNIAEQNVRTTIRRGGD